MDKKALRHMTYGLFLLTAQEMCIRDRAMLLLAPLAQREEDKPTSLALALLLLLLQNPYAGAGVGLQLSFAASAGIYLCSGTLYERWAWYLPLSLIHISLSAGVPPGPELSERRFSYRRWQDPFSVVCPFGWS